MTLVTCDRLHLLLLRRRANSDDAIVPIGHQETAMNRLNDSIASLDPRTRDLLEKYLPWVVVALLVWLASKSFSKLFWGGFAMYWALRGSGIRWF